MGWELASVKESDQDAADIGVEDRDANAVSECEECTSGVGSHAGEESQLLHSQGHLTFVFFDDGVRATFEAQCARWIAQVCPGHDNVRGGRLGEVAGVWPSLHPFDPDRLDARDGCLLAHNFENEGSPVGHVVVSHG